MINVALAREIYGGIPWMVDPISFSSLFSILSDFRAGASISVNEDEKLNQVFLLDVSSKSYLLSRPYQLENLSEDAEVVSIVHLNGPITKNGGSSSFGTKQISARMNQMTKDKRVKGHILLTDSGGGSSNAIVYMADAIKKSQSEGKPVVQLIEKSSLSASAAYFIGSYSDYIIAEDKFATVGSLGTMIEFAGYPKKHKRKSDGAVFVRAYATSSFNKNGNFEQAIEGNLEPVINNLLNPVNERFLSQVQENRKGVLLEEHLTGETYMSGEVVGTLVDEIGSLEKAIGKVLQLSESKQIKNFKPAIGPTNKSLINKGEKMNLSELKSEHKAVYGEAFAEGVSAEADRIGAWMAHAETDMEAVKAGIASGKPISQTAREEFLVKLSSQKHVDDIKKDGAESKSKAESKTADSSEDDEAKSFYDDIKNKLK